MRPERRSASRLRGYLPVHVQPTDSVKALDTLTKDVSAGGLRCLSPVPVPVGSDVRLEVLLSGSPAPVNVSGSTRWFREIPFSEMFEIGVSFEVMEPETARRLSTYLERLSQLQAPVTA